MHVSSCKRGIHEYIIKGLKYGIKNNKIDTYELLSRFEELAQS
jgi:hypothetical protein